mgnify:CR=1 FL=1
MTMHVPAFDDADELPPVPVEPLRSSDWFAPYTRSSDVNAPEPLAMVKVGNSECEFLKLTPLSRNSAIATASPI